MVESQHAAPRADKEKRVRGIGTRKGETGRINAAAAIHPSSHAGREAQRLLLLKSSGGGGDFAPINRPPARQTDFSSR